MGLLSKAILILVGLFALGTGLWPITLVCFLYLSRPIWRARAKKDGPGPKGTARAGTRPSARLLVLAALGSLSVLAVAAGGRLSAAVLISLVAVVLVWPRVAPALLLDSVIPVEGTILLRSRFLPFRWFSVAEVKSGNENLPRNLSHVEGELMLDTGSRAVYYLARARAFDEASARAKVLSEFRRAARYASPNGAYLLPIDGAAACEKFRSRLSREPFDASQFANERSPIPDVLVIRSRGGFVEGISAYSAYEPRARGSVIPDAAVTKERPLLWEILERVGKTHPWKQPDPKAEFLESLFLTKGAQLSERTSSLRGSAEMIAVETIGGSPLEFSRPQLRAILSIYQ